MHRVSLLEELAVEDGALLEPLEHESLELIFRV
jgi:hypothetical protein